MGRRFLSPSGSNGFFHNQSSLETTPQRGAEFDRRVERWSLPRIRLHDMRLTWVTLALEAGVPAKVVSERLGHANISITLDVYSHVNDAMDAGAADRVAAVIFGTDG